MEITKVVKPFIRRRWPNTFVNIVYLAVEATTFDYISYTELGKYCAILI